MMDANPCEGVPIGRSRGRPRHKHFAVAVISIVFALVAASCGGSASTGNRANLTVAVEASTAGVEHIWEHWGSQFHKANPNITVHFNFIPVDSYGPTLLTELQGGAGPDIFYTNPGSGQIYSALQLARNGHVANLSAQPWRNDIPSVVKSLYWSGGNLYALPLDVTAIGLLYNKDLLSSWNLSPPKSFSQLLNVCRVATSHGVAAIQAAGGSPQNIGLFGQIIASSYVYDSDPNWNTQRQKKSVTFAGSKLWNDALQTVVTMRQDGCFPKGAAGLGADAAEVALAQNQGLMVSQLGNAYGDYQTLDPSFEKKIGFIPFPGKSSSDTRVTLAYSDSISVNSHSSEKSDAIKFVDFIASGDRLSAYATANYAMTPQQVRTGAVPSYLSGLSPYLKAKRVSNLAELGWSNGSVYNDFTTGLTGLLSGQTTPSALLQQMDTAWSTGS